MSSNEIATSKDSQVPVVTRPQRSSVIGSSIDVGIPSMKVDGNVPQIKPDDKQSKGTPVKGSGTVVEGGKKKSNKRKLTDNFDNSESVEKKKSKQ